MDIPAIRVRLSSYGINEAAVAWVLKALHPAGDLVSPGMPDEVSAKALRSQYETVATISAPGLVEWDLAVWKPSGDGTAFIAASGAAGVDFLDPAAAVTLTVVPNIPPVITGAFTITTAETVPVQKTIQIRSPATLPNAFRKQYSSLTCHLVASALNNQGTVFASQLSHREQLDQAAFPVSFNQVAAVYRLFDIPPDQTILALMDSGMYTAEAREGVYLPLRHSGPSAPYISPASYNSYSWTEPGTGGLYWPVAATTDAFQTAPVSPNVPFLPVLAGRRFAATGVYSGLWGGSGRGATIITDPNSTLDSGFCAMSQAMVVFRGLSPAASVTVKSIDGMEVIPNFDSPALQFATMPPPPSAKALELYYLISRELRYCYPARANAFGAILPFIARAATAIWPFVRPLIAPAATAVASHFSQPPQASTSAPPVTQPPARERQPAKPRAKRGAAPTKRAQMSR